MRRKSQHQSPVPSGRGTAGRTLQRDDDVANLTTESVGLEDLCYGFLNLPRSRPSLDERPQTLQNAGRRYGLGDQPRRQRSARPRAPARMARLLTDPTAPVPAPTLLRRISFHEIAERNRSSHDHRGEPQRSSGRLRVCRKRESSDRRSASRSGSRRLRQEGSSGLHAAQLEMSCDDEISSCSSFAVLFFSKVLDRFSN